MNQETNKMQCVRQANALARGKRTYVPPLLHIYPIETEHYLLVGSGQHKKMEAGGVLGDDEDYTPNDGAGSHNPFDGGGILGDTE